MYSSVQRIESRKIELIKKLNCTKETNVMLNVQELTKRYNLKNVQTIRKFITRNLDKINANGTHAFQDSTGWLLDDEAVRILDDLRNFSKVAVIQESESEQIQELKEEVANLKSLLLMTQNKLVQKQEELAESQKQLLDSQKQLLSAEKKYLTAENTSNVEELKRQHLEEKLSATENQLSATKKQLSEVQNQYKNLQTEVEKLKKRGLVSRIFNNL